MAQDNHPPGERRRPSASRQLAMTYAITVGTVVVAFFLASISGALDWASHGAFSPVRPTTPLVVPPAPPPTDTSPRAAAQIQAASQARVAAAARADSQYTADRAAEASDIASRRAVAVGILTALAGLAALSVVWTNWQGIKQQRQEALDTDRRARKALKQQRQQAAEEQRRADRLHLTQLFDSAASHLGAKDDATRIAGVFILERLHSDAGDLLGDARSEGQRRSLQRSVINTLCGYIREQSAAHSSDWHHRLEPSHDLADGLHESYGSPPSIQAAISALGRLSATDIERLDLSGAHLANIEFRGVYEGLDLTSSLLSNILFMLCDLAGSSPTFTRSIVTRGVVFTATSATGLVFTHAKIRGVVAWFDDPVANHRIRSLATFDDAIIEGKVDLGSITTSAFFRRAEIAGVLELHGVGDMVALARATVAGTVYLAGIGGRIELDHAPISGTIDLRNAGTTLLSLAGTHPTTERAETIYCDDAGMTAQLRAVGLNVVNDDEDV